MRVAGEIAARLGGGDEAFPEHLLESLRALIGSDTAAYAELDRVGQRVLAGAGVGGHDR